jgi:hypothetical protein
MPKQWAEMNRRAVLGIGFPAGTHSPPVGENGPVGGIPTLTYFRTGPGGKFCGGTDMMENIFKFFLLEIFDCVRSRKIFRVGSRLKFPVGASPHQVSPADPLVLP